MGSIRIIPRLDIKGPNLVKGIHLEGLRVMGKPSDFARHYYENGADELLYVDVVASLYERNSLHDLIKETSRDIFIPLTVGGGLRTVDDIRSVLRAGADKVSLNTAAIKNPGIIREASMRFGSSTIVVTIEAIKQADGTYLCFIDNGREYTGVEAGEWAQRVEEMGAGELILTSVDKEGTGKGFDLEFIQKISNLVGIPVIAHGGAGSKEDIYKVVTGSDCEAVSAASLFHYHYIKNAEFFVNDAEGNFDFLLSGENIKHIRTTTLPELKSYLLEKGLNIRNEYASI
jgi:cyclase